jgi:hypothetical protein
MSTRRRFLVAGALAGTSVVPGLARAQAGNAEIKFKLGNDLPVTHSVNVRLKEAIEAIAAETKAASRSSCFRTISSAAIRT